MKSPEQIAEQIRSVLLMADDNLLTRDQLVDGLTKVQEAAFTAGYVVGGKHALEGVGLL